MRHDSLHLQKRVLYLRGEYVHPTDNQHIVRTAHYAAHAHMGAAAGAGLVGQDAQIMRPVPQQRHAVLGKCREGQIPLLAIRQATVFRADHFRQEMILPDVHALLAHALYRHPRAHDFTQAVDVDGVDAQHFFNFLAHGLSPRLRAEDAAAQLGVLNPLGMQRFGQVKRIGRRAAQAG